MKFFRNDDKPASKAAYELEPSDWVGHTILKFPDGYVGLDGALTTKERVHRGEQYIAAYKITFATKPGDVADFLAREPMGHTGEERTS